MSEVQAPGISEREITIYATRGGQMQKIMTSATTWGELQPLLRREGFDLSSLLAAENINKSDLVNDLAVLPTTAFRLFLRPKQTKSGALDRKECFAVIKAHIAVYPQDKSKFVIDGKNMTQLSTPVVQDLVAKYCQGSTAPATTAPVTTETVEKVKEVARAVKQLVTNEKEDRALTETERVEKALTLIAPLSQYPSYHKALKHLGLLRFETTGEDCEEAEETEQEAIAREAREMGY
jgi:hypothetical protein